MSIKTIPDPRSSWPGYHFPEDSELWSKLLTIAHRRNPQLYGVLWVFRIEGTRIVKLRNGNFGLRPEIRARSSDNPDEGWRDAADYKQCAKKFLAPWHDLLVEVLGELRKAAEAGNEEERQIALEI